mmetsp:Transcript_18680/g.27935  ORF Transcript_18680/g.27935 Transcript_18680/m.27935 type:complete len:359 (+) Transcript_18680:90-1166(+)|eukprot:CAMPEP_0167755502 /NCGR_PEP_ID=MMETSP0110_2-20121227/8864_1 /TAXON_ID=629695 /ORGANISM="Gymnochlora sp., Strain CCMP2014" /LENGTH=358 /DNA_ID=CAMNT_0007641505 /DNA_START=78 /DNA_END=1154 /DNA_ORIENTATION=+
MGFLTLWFECMILVFFLAFVYLCVHINKHWEKKDRHIKALKTYGYGFSHVVVWAKGSFQAAKRFGEDVFEGFPSSQTKDDRKSQVVVAAREGKTHHELILAPSSEEKSVLSESEVKHLGTVVSFAGGIASLPTYQKLGIEVVKKAGLVVRLVNQFRPVMVRPCVVVLGERDEQDLGMEVLLTQRAKHMRTWPERWVFPGGHIDPGEFPVTAASREFEEETGLTIKKETMKLLGVFQALAPLHMRQYVMLIYKARVTEPWAELAVDPHEVQAGGWVSKEVANLLCYVEQDKIPKDEEIMAMVVTRKPTGRKKRNGTMRFSTACIKNVTVTSMSEGLALGHKYALKLWIDDVSKKDEKSG